MRCGRSWDGPSTRHELPRPHPLPPSAEDPPGGRQARTQAARGPRRGPVAAARHVIHFLLFEQETDARAAAGAIDGDSWTTRVDPPTPTVAEWAVRIDGHRVVGPDTVAAFRAQFELTAAAHDGEYDGWEAAATYRLRCRAACPRGRGHGPHEARRRC